MCMVVVRGWEEVVGFDCVEEVQPFWGLKMQRRGKTAAPDTLTECPKISKWEKVMATATQMRTLHLPLEVVWRILARWRAHWEDHSHCSMMKIH